MPTAGESIIKLTNAAHIVSRCLPMIHFRAEASSSIQKALLDANSFDSIFSCKQVSAGTSHLLIAYMS